MTWDWHATSGPGWWFPKHVNELGSRTNPGICLPLRRDHGSRAVDGYSNLKATDGRTRAARQAGRAHAIIDTITNSVATLA
jgi:hypothetical protein